jgi:hypothetical protein
MDGPSAHLEEREALRRQRPERRPLDCQEVGQHLLSGGAVDAQLGHRPVPALEVGIDLLQATREAPAL